MDVPRNLFTPTLEGFRNLPCDGTRCFVSLVQSAFSLFDHTVFFFFSLIRTSLGCLGFIFICETSAKARVHFRASGPPNIPKQLVQCAFAWARSVSCVERQRLEFSVASCAAEVLASVFLLVSFLTPPFQGSSRCV